MKTEIPPWSAYAEQIDSIISGGSQESGTEQLSSQCCHNLCPCKAIHLCKPHFAHLQNGGNVGLFILRLLGLDGILYEKMLSVESHTQEAFGG